MPVLDLEMPERGYAESRATATSARGCLARGKGHAKASHCLFGVCGPLRGFRKV